MVRGSGSSVHCSCFSFELICCTTPAAAAPAACSDEMGDFIVGGEDVDKRRARRDARVAQEAGLTADAVQAATRMFGNFGELLDLHASHKIYGADATEEEEGLDEEEVG